MEGWQLYLGLHERREELISGTACRVWDAKTNRGGACIHMVDPTCSAQEEQDHRETQDQILGQDSQVWSQDPKERRRGQEIRQREWQYALVGLDLQGNEKRLSVFASWGKGGVPMYTAINFARRFPLYLKIDLSPPVRSLRACSWPVSLVSRRVTNSCVIPASLFFYLFRPGLL
jgi:hypothetical protein